MHGFEFTYDATTNWGLMLGIAGSIVGVPLLLALCILLVMKLTRTKITRDRKAVTFLVSALALTVLSVVGFAVGSTHWNRAAHASDATLYQRVKEHYDVTTFQQPAFFVNDTHSATKQVRFNDRHGNVRRGKLTVQAHGDSGTAHAVLRVKHGKDYVEYNRN